MRRAAVGLYCAVVDQVDPLGVDATIPARETHAGFNQRAQGLRTWLVALNLGSGEDWQREPESRAMRLMGVRPKFSAVGVDDRPA
jgi:hypothetical protein